MLTWSQAEREFLGIVHVEVGVWMISQWGLPGYLRELVRGSHDPSSPVPEDLATGAVVSVRPVPLRTAGFAAPVTDRRFRRHDRCRRCLDMERDAFQQVMDLFLAESQGRAALLNIPSLTPNEIAGILERAKETLMARTLNRLTEVHEVKPETEVWDSRTRALEGQAFMDRLTELFNRCSLQHRLNDDFVHATEHGTPLNVAFIELERLKQNWPLLC